MPASATAELPSPLVVAAHDAGAANLIIGWLAEDARCDLRPIMEGPAAELWRRCFGEAPGTNLDAALVGAGAVLSGTSWASDLEHRARVVARRAGVRSVAVIDHWTNYPQRFVRNNERCLPDEIWVTDDGARALATTAFPDTPVAVRPNRYLAATAARAAAVTPIAGRVLYVLEPMHDDWGRGRAGEFQALDYLADHIDVLDAGPVPALVLRPHPSDPAGKYDGWVATARALGIDASLVLGGELADAIGAATVVVGCQTMALVVALGAGRRAVSTLPPWAPSCVLPHTELLRLRQLVDAGRARRRSDGSKCTIVSVR